MSLCVALFSTHTASFCCLTLLTSCNISMRARQEIPPQIFDSSPSHTDKMPLRRCCFCSSTLSPHDRGSKASAVELLAAAAYRAAIGCVGGKSNLFVCSSCRRHPPVTPFSQSSVQTAASTDQTPQVSVSSTSEDSKNMLRQSVPHLPFSRVALSLISPTSSHHCNLLCLAAPPRHLPPLLRDLPKHRWSRCSAGAPSC